MSYEFIQVDRDDHLTIITINRPERMNALHPPTNHELDAAFNDFEDDPDQWVGIITGAGDRAFCAGNDLRFQAEHGGAAVRDGNQGLRGGFAGLVSRHTLNKPLIAAVNGFALGGGFEIVLACDIILMSEAATVGLPEPKVGLMAAAGGVHRLPRQIPYHLAMGMMLTGRHITPQEAQSYGLVNEIVGKDDDLLAAARKWAAMILECSPLSVRATKEAASGGLSMSLGDAMGTPFPAQVTMGQSEDFVEGPKAFAEKRKPNWKGR